MGKVSGGITKTNPHNKLAISDSDTKLLIDIDGVMENCFVSFVVLPI